MQGCGANDDDDDDDIELRCEGVDWIHVTRESFTGRLL
jgi:hypothetical protein